MIQAKTGFLAPDIKGPFINYGELGGLQNRRGWGGESSFATTKKKGGWGGGGGENVLAMLKGSGGEHKKC